MKFYQITQGYYYTEKPYVAKRCFWLDERAGSGVKVCKLYGFGVEA